MKLIDKAIELELSGEQYYHQQTLKNQGTTLEPVFNYLALSELKHAQLLRQVAAGVFPEVDLEESGQEDNLFASLGDFKVDAAHVPDQLNVYRSAQDIEHTMIEVYQKLLKDSTNPDEKRVLAFLVIQEQRHLKLMESLGDLLQNAEEWVESAEFGRRETEF
ncbi:MAG: hypothetical protein EOM70_02225 [Clostridia bacterium]|nr:hypothetical protein [Clostridia bacterium]